MLLRPPSTRRCLAAALAGLAVLALAPAAGAQADAPTARVDLVVGFAGSATAAHRTHALLEAGARVDERLAGVDAAVVSVTAGDAAAALAELRADGAVQYAARESFRAPALAPNDPLYATRTWPFVETALTKAWDVTTGDAAAVIAVLDSGVDPSHPDLPPLAPGWDFVNDDADPADDLGHGTEVAGAIGARLGNRIGAAGVCPGCAIMPVKVLDGVSGTASDRDIVAGIIWATDHGADVINLSLAGPDWGQMLHDGVAYAISRGVVVVAAGGNDGTTTKQYPAALDGVVGVAASDDRGRLYDFSNHGAHLDLAAPGCLHTTLRGGAYGVACGTSLAAPVVAGIAGLVRSRRPALTGEQVASVLTAGANGGLGLDVASGLVDAYRALALADALDPHPADTTPAVAPPSTGVQQSPAPSGVQAAVTIRGAAKVGRRLVARVGAGWLGADPHRFRFQWQACSTVEAVLRCSSLRGRTSAALLVARSHVGKRLRVRTLAIAADGTTAVRLSPVSALVRR